MCWLSRRNHLYIPRSHPTECVYCSAQSFCFLEKQNFLFTSFNLKEAMRLSSTNVMKMTWKQNKQSQKAFRRQNLQCSRKICLRLTVFVLNQVRFFVTGASSVQTYTTRHTWLFTQKIISEEKIIISTLDKYCAFIIGASLSEPHTDVLAWDSVTRDIYRYGGTDRYLWAGAFSPYFFLARPRRSQAPHRAAHNAHTDAQYKAA